MTMEINDYIKISFSCITLRVVSFFSRPWSRGHKKHFVISFNHPGRIHGERLITDIGAATARVARSAWMFFYVLFEKSNKSRFRCQVYTRLNYLKFEIPKIFWGGAHRALSPDPSPRSFSGFALDSGFALKSRALRALDSGFARFGPPQLLKRGCAPGRSRIWRYLYRVIWHVAIVATLLISYISLQYPIYKIGYCSKTSLLSHSGSQGRLSPLEWWKPTPPMVNPPPPPDGQPPPPPMVHVGDHGIIHALYKSQSCRCHPHHHQLNVHFLPRSIKGMDGCFPTALSRQSTYSNILGPLV